MIKHFIALMLLPASLMMSAATVITGESKLSYSSEVPDAGKIDISFAKCMANELFTFSSVAVNGKIINRTSSDNIGPFGLAGRGWSGGNHLNNDMRSAHTDRVTVEADGRRLNLSQPDTLECERLKIIVVNTLLMPADTIPFATETMVYSVEGNSIEVDARHDFLYPEPVLVDRYYGMQSMMVDEIEILTPGGTYSKWTPVEEVSEFTLGSSPRFSTFIEHSPAGYQACWMDPEVDLGDHHLVSPDDVAFIGNSWSKSYHKIIGSRQVKPGDTTHWHGVYSWFDRPIVDNCKDAPGTFAFPGVVRGKNTIFQIGADGRTTLMPKARILKIMTYNLRFGECASMRRIAEEIKAQNPDFVALQELDICTNRNAARANNGINFTNELAFHTGMFGQFGRTINLGKDGYYGIGILSRHPMTSIDNIELPNPTNAEPRALLMGRFLLDGDTPIIFASTHLDFQSKETQARQAEFIVDILNGQDIPSIVAGDFNSVAGSEVHKIFSTGANLSSSAPTFPADAPDKKLDYIFGFPAADFKLLGTGEGPASKDAASDHLPVFSTISVELK